MTKRTKKVGVTGKYGTRVSPTPRENHEQLGESWTIDLELALQTTLCDRKQELELGTMDMAARDSRKDF